MTSERRRVGVVVGEGHPVRRGLLRFVLEGEGFLVLADASTAVELVQALAVHRPEAVILDDAIGSTAVVLTREMCPDAKIVLVWPPDLSPINGDATVDPTQVLRELGPAVERACGLLDVRARTRGGPVDAVEAANQRTIVTRAPAWPTSSPVRACRVRARSPMKTTRRSSSITNWHPS